jgi:hypothetical protein
MDKEALFKMNFDCGRQGSLKSVFISTKEKVKYLIDNKLEVYFGEVLGKHSEVFGTFESKEITFITSDENVLNVVKEHGLCNGIDPIEEPLINCEDELYTDDMSCDEFIELKLAQLKK